ncbi:MAG: hypothetical protein PSX81_06260 [bacterium]|nr:hypothetical protein [bacterium]
MNRHSPTDLKIAGIKANLYGYQVAWLVNQSFDMQLTMNEDWIIGEDSTEKSEHLHFFQEFEDVELKWYLVQNRGSAGVLYQSKPLFDYFLICFGEDIYGYFERAVSAIIDAGKIDGIFPLSFSLIKTQENFLTNMNVKNNKKYIESPHV